MAIRELEPCAFGWQPDLPDWRDLTVASPDVQQALAALTPRPDPGPPPEEVDLREFFPPITDQAELHSSTAHACVALVDYFVRRATGRTVRSSTRFVYKLTRRLLNRPGNAACDLRTTWKAIARFGIPPYAYFPDDDDHFDDEPEAFAYGWRKEFSTLYYVRLSPPLSDGREALRQVKAFLAAGLPSVFGFSVPASLSLSADIPWRPAYESLRGGQAVVAVGYDDHRVSSTKGALLIRNSWGPGWGDGGYGYLPYRFLESGAAADFWTVVSPRWLDPDEFHHPALAGPPG